MIRMLMYLEDTQDRNVYYLLLPSPTLLIAKASTWPISPYHTVATLSTDSVSLGTVRGQD